MINLGNDIANVEASQLKTSACKKKDKRMLYFSSDIMDQNQVDAPEADSLNLT